MPTVAGFVLDHFEIANEYGNVEKWKNEFNKGDKVWMYYARDGTLKGVELQQPKDIPISQK
jgi:phosphoserine aminotransferase